LSESNATDATSEGSDAATILEMTVLNELLALGGKSFVEDVVAIFLTETPQRLVALRVALAKGDLRMVRQVAHALAGGGGQIGVAGFSSVAREAEELAIRGDLDAIGNAVARLDSAEPVVLGALTRWLASLSNPVGEP
jgi:HPt (histidine-containing phosphotransfer) domain-containing protein